MGTGYPLGGAGDEGGPAIWRSAFGRILLLLIILTGAAPITSVRAQSQDGVEDAAPAAIPGLAVVENDATVEFPDGITFTLDAESTDPVANVELMYRPTGLETFSVELPPFETGTTDLDIEQSIDSGPGGSRELPPGIDIQYHWRITETDGDIIETPEQTFFWTDDRFEWTTLSGPNVTVYSYDADPAFQQEILDSAERTVASLVESYGAELDQQVRIWVYANREDFYGTQQPFAHQWAAGANYGELHLIMVVLPPGDHSEVARVVPHEISHQVLHQATENPFSIAPGWLEEGLAMYWQESGRESFYSHALELAAEGQVPPLRTLNGPSSSWPYDRNDTTALYALSLTAVMYILDTWGDEGMSNLLETVGEGVTHEEAVQQGLGISFDELDRQWREDLIADAQQLGAAGSTRFNDSGPSSSSPWSSFGEGLVLAAESVLLGLVILIALIAGLVSVIRARRQPEPDAEEVDGVRWGEWPTGLEPTAWQENVHGQRGW